MTTGHTVNPLSAALKLRWRRLAFIISLFAVALGGIALSLWEIRVADRRLRADLLEQATLISWAIRADQVDSLSGSEADLATPIYQRIKAQLVQARSLFPNCRFLYLLRKDAQGHTFFLADSEPPDSPDYSPPGQRYEEADLDLQAIFETAHPAVEGPVKDRWGTWISAWVPLYHPMDEHVVAALGMDRDATRWHVQSLKPAIPVLLITALLLAVMLAGYLALPHLHRRYPATAEALFARPAIHITLLCGLWLTAVTGHLLHQGERHARRSVFHKAVTLQSSLLQQAMFRIGDNYLEGLGRLFLSSNFVDQNEYNRYTSYLLNRPYALAWQWIPMVEATNRVKFTTDVRTWNYPDFSLWEYDEAGQPRPAAERANYFPVCYVEPLAKNTASMGYDWGSDPLARTAIETAWETRLTVASDPLQTPRGGKTNLHIVVFRPVFSLVDSTRLSGLAAVVLDMDYLLFRALSRESTHSESLSEVDLYQVPSDGSFIHVAARHPVGKESSCPNLQERIQDPCVLMAPVFAFGKVYALAARPSSDFFSMHPSQALARVLLAGLLITTLATALVGLLGNRRAALESMVQERTTALRASESSYHGLFNAIQQAIYIQDEQARFLDVNEGALAMYGYTREEMLGQTPEFLAAPGRNALGKLAPIMEAARLGKPQHFEFWGRRKNGEVFPKEVWLYPGTYFGRSVIVAIASDISERKQAEQALHDTNERLHTYIEAIPDAVFIKDGEGRWMVINRAAEHLFQMEGFAWRGKTDLEMAAERPLLATAFQQCAKADEQTWQAGALSLGVEKVMGPEGQLLTFDVRKLPLFERDGRRKTLIVIGRDITEKTLAEEEKSRLQLQLQQAQKLESIGRLAGGVAHDFNNMLQVILGNVSMGLGEIAPGHPVREFLEEIQKAGQRSADLTRQLLAFASRQAAHPRLLDLNTTITGMIKMLRRLIGEDIQLSWQPGPDLWPVKMDPSQVDQILANLAVNARDAIGGVGTVSIATTNLVCRDEAYTRQFIGCTPGDYVLLTVRDTGHGMDEETRAHVFEPFFTTKERGKGVGLGLATVFGIVKQNGGFIDVKSAPGQGATFSIGLPKAIGDVVPDTTTTEAPQSRGGPETLLLVEDEEAVLRFSLGALTKLGYRVLAAESPAQALDLARRHQGDIHLLVTDVVLPNMNGRELAQLMSSIVPGIQCLFMSGYTADIIANLGVVDEHVNFIQKPFHPDELAAKIRNILG